MKYDLKDTRSCILLTIVCVMCNAEQCRVVNNMFMTWL